MPEDDSSTGAVGGGTSTVRVDGAQLQPGQRIGHYKILEQIGEGGFAIVYLAEQEKPVRRRVALKIIKLGMDTKQVIARFEAERQALAMMDHANVAKVFDAGATDTGRPYFVMEYVAGTSITEYCDRHRLDIGQRLRLFIQVCEAVQHAHQKAIIHRDIKPTNVLVSVKEGEPLIKVIDFGVAKAISQRLTEKTIYTEQGQLIGTPEYMSPEQAEMGELDIDTRSDIYSLGVLLYELLTGALPFDPTTLRQAGFGEIQRIIREQEPPKPSTRLSSLGDDSATSAKKRRADPRSLLRELRGDLDWIAMKALEKDRTRRYETASELAADVERHFKNEPVLAGPPSPAYRVNKFIGRHKLGVMAAAIFVIILVGATVATSWGLVRATVAEHKAERRRAAAEFLRDRAERKLTRLNAASVVFELVVAEEMSEAVAEDQLTWLKLFISATEPAVYDRPELLLAMKELTGEIFLRLGWPPDIVEQQLSDAVALNRELHGDRSVEVLDCQRLLCEAMAANGKIDEALDLARSVLAESRRLRGVPEIEVSDSLVLLARLLIARGDADQAGRLIQEAVGIEAELLGSPSGGCQAAIRHLALLLEKDGKPEKAAEWRAKLAEQEEAVASDSAPP